MSRKAPAVQFYAEDFLNGTRYMSNAEVGLYIRLLAEQVDKGSIPDNVEHFVKAFGKECRKLWPAVRAKFVEAETPGTILNERMQNAIAARDAYRLKQSEKGKKSASARANPVEPEVNRGSTVVEPLGDGDGDSISSGKERARKQPDHRITELIDHLKAVNGGSIDGTIARNRQACHTMLQRMAKDYPDRDPLETVRNLIDIAKADEFHAPNCTSFEYLVRNGIKIINAFKTKRNGKQTIQQAQSDIERIAAQRYGG